MTNRAAQALGRLAAGHPKHYSPEERARRAERMRRMNVERAKKSEGAATFADKP